MSTVAENKNGKASSNANSQELVIRYVPLGETEQIELTLSRVRNFLCIPTKSGVMPTYQQVVKFMMLCQAQCLNPWVNDAFLVGYDGRDGAEFSLITSHQAILKRAEASPEYDGMESGVVVLRNDVITERQGDLVLKGETLVGGWARVYRRDRKIPSYDALNLDTFNTNRSRWTKDPAGMIVKVAEASSLRKAFPSSLSALYCKEEMDREREHQTTVQANVVAPVSKADRLASRLVPAITDERTTAITTEMPTPEADPVPVAREHSQQEEINEQAGEESQDEIRVTLDMMLAWIDSATRNEFKSIESRINRELETGDFDQREVDQVTVALQERRKQLK